MDVQRYYEMEDYVMTTMDVYLPVIGKHFKDYAIEGTAKQLSKATPTDTLSEIIAKDLHTTILNVLTAREVRDISLLTISVAGLQNIQEKIARLDNLMNPNCVLFPFNKIGHHTPAKEVSQQEFLDTILSKGGFFPYSIFDITLEQNYESYQPEDVVGVFHPVVYDQNVEYSYYNEDGDDDNYYENLNKFLCCEILLKNGITLYRSVWIDEHPTLKYKYS